MQKIDISKRYQGVFDGILLDHIAKINEYLDTIERLDFRWNSIKDRIIFQYYKDISEIEILSHTFGNFFSDEEENLIDDGFGNLYTKYHLPILVRKKNSTGLYDYYPTVKFYWNEDEWNNINKSISNVYSNKSKLNNLFNKKRLEGLAIQFEEEVKIIDGMTLWRNAFEMTNCWIHGPVTKLLDCSGITIYSKLINYDTESKVSSFTNASMMGGFCAKNLTITRLKFNNCAIDKISLIDAEILELEIDSNVINVKECTLKNSSINKLNIRNTKTKLFPMLHDVGKIGIIHFDEYVIGGDYDKDFSENCLSYEKSPIPVPYFLKNRKYLDNISNHLQKLDDSLHVIRTALPEKPKEFIVNRFHRYELWVKSLNPSIDASHRYASSLYRYSANYGDSIGRPFIYVSILLLLCSIIYMFIYTSHLGWKFQFFRFDAIAYFGDALSFSLNRMFPLIKWGADASNKESFSNTIEGLNGFGGLLAHAISIFQTVGTAILFFLSGLAAKRKFKIDKS
ncbi:hypothetical protein PQU92_15630 [Asticcacaulis sp. BYS171W]|uniref:Pentapeptide repeat-containing protein n=1 Tax=Asticcacaulis aquaticus TaxID=2984212 RepID=A0ABT5HXB7_9CAUL|nr:hypothetical protein [Asticcacaulis aquaticus]MDC7684715.1 hypothetical protein [Asticcacaulis aquaticus]